jgi:hypothetical protein
MIEELIQRSWCAETSQNPNNWNSENSSLGQCEITACLLHETLGLELTRGQAILPDGTIERHYWNDKIDLTRDQFPKGTIFKPTDGPQGKDAYIFALQSMRTHHRLNILRDRVQNAQQQI